MEQDNIGYEFRAYTSFVVVPCEEEKYNFRKFINRILRLIFP